MRYSNQEIFRKSLIVGCFVDHPLHIKVLTLSKRQILDSSKLKDFADDNFKVDENGGKFFKRIESTVGRGEIARYEQFLLFP